MSDRIIQLNKKLIKHDMKDLVRSSVKENLNALLDKKAGQQGGCPTCSCEAACLVRVHKLDVCLTRKMI